MIKYKINDNIVKNPKIVRAVESIKSCKLYNIEIQGKSAIQNKVSDRLFTKSEAVSILDMIYNAISKSTYSNDDYIIDIDNSLVIREVSL